MANQGATGRIAGLDGLRAIAALMVFLEHRTECGVLHLGGYGVRLFFVLSGFLIIGGLVRDAEAIARGEARMTRAIGRFFIHRAFRILPVYWLTLSGAALLLALGATRAVSWQELSWNLLFAGNIYVGQIAGHWTAALSHLWSLAVEEQFYLFVAPLLLLAGRRWSLVVCIALVGAALVQEARLLVMDVSPVRLGTDSIIGFGTIALGGLLFQWSRPLTAGLGDAGALACLVLYLACPLAIAAMPREARWMEPMSILVAGALILAVSRRPNSLLVRMLEFWPLARLGQISYGFYVYHYWLTAPVVYSGSGGLIDVRQAPVTIQAGTLFLLSLAAASGSWVLIEKPLLMLRKRLAAGRRGLTSNACPPLCPSPPATVLDLDIALPRSSAAC